MKRAPIHLAVWKGNFDIIKELVTANCDLNLKAMDNFTVLHFAVQGNNDTIIQYILRKCKKNKSLINSKISKGQKTALHIAAKNNNFNVVKALIEAGADKNIKNSSGQNAFDLSTNIDIKTYLKSNASDINYIKSKTSKNSNHSDEVIEMEVEEGNDTVDESIEASISMPSNTSNDIIVNKETESKINDDLHEISSTSNKRAANNEAGLLNEDVSGDKKKIRKLDNPSVKLDHLSFQHDDDGSK